jgi:two-component system sensor histidine kinase RegB
MFRLLRICTSDNQAGHLDLRTIVYLRWIALLGQFSALVAVYWGMGFDLPILPCLLIIALSVVLNTYVLYRWSANTRLSDCYVLPMLGYDIIQLGFLLYLTGGLNNPFALLLMFPVTISAWSQPLSVTALLGSMTIAASCLLFFFHLPLPWYANVGINLPTIYVAGFLAAIICGVIFIGFYSWLLGLRSRLMADALAATEMILAREKRFCALDGMAAAAAHELGTPLSTIYLTSRELQKQLPEGAEYSEDIAIIAEQAERSREILSRFAAWKDEADLVFTRMKLSELLDEIITRQQGVDINIRIDAAPSNGAAGKWVKEPVVTRNPGMMYGIGNIVENAVDFAVSEVVLQARWDNHKVTLSIRDDGPGFSDEIIGHLGNPYVTTRASTKESSFQNGDNPGMGLGYFIAETLIKRSMGEISCRNGSPPDAGAIVTISWPRSQVDIGSSSKENISHP